MASPSVHLPDPRCAGFMGEGLVQLYWMAVGRERGISVSSQPLRNALTPLGQ